MVASHLNDWRQRNGTMWMLLLLFFIGAGLVSAGAVISACTLAGQIDCEQMAIASGDRRGCADAEAPGGALGKGYRRPALST